MNNLQRVSECSLETNSLHNGGGANGNPIFLIDENESEYDELNDENLILEESPNGRWNKLATEISVQNLPDFDTIYLAIDTEKGLECAWNEIHVNELITKFNDFRKLHLQDENLNYLYEQNLLYDLVNLNLKSILNYLKKLDHLNILTFYDYWYVNHESNGKWVVITELSSAGSLKKLLDNARQTKTAIKQKTYKRWLNQLLNAIRYIHMQDLSIFKGNLSTDTIFIQNNSAIKIAPTLLKLVFSTLITNNYTKHFYSNPIFNNVPANSPTATPSTPPTPNTNITVHELLQLNDTIVDKDLYSIGRIATEIFFAHLTLSTIFTNLTANKINGSNSLGFTKLVEILSHKENIDKIDLIDVKQKDFIYACLNPNELILIHNEDQDEKIAPSLCTYKRKSKLLSYQPIINEIYSLKVLSVYSLLAHFQHQHLKSYSNSDLLFSDENNQNDDFSVFQDNTTSTVTTSSNTDTDSNQLLFANLRNNTNLRVNNNFLRPQRSAREYNAMRKVSLNSLTNVFNLPKDFFAILEDIKLGCYPRLHNKTDTPNICDASFNILKSIPSGSFNQLDPQQQQQQQHYQYHYMNDSDTIEEQRTPNNTTPTSMCTSKNPSSPSTKSSMSVDDLFNPKLSLHNKTITADDFNIDSPTELTNGHHHDQAQQQQQQAEPTQIESRRVRYTNCLLVKTSSPADSPSTLSPTMESQVYQLVLKLKFDDNLNRVLECAVPSDTFIYLHSQHHHHFKQQMQVTTPTSDTSPLNTSINDEQHYLCAKVNDVCVQLTSELIEYGLINTKDRDIIVNSMKKALMLYV